VFGAAALGCGGPKTTTPTQEGSIAITINPTSASIEQGGSASVTATLTRGGGFTGPVTITVEGAPAGVTGAASNVQTTGTTTTATITIAVEATTAPGSYALVVRGRGTGVRNAEASFALAVTAKPAFTLAIAPNVLSIRQGENATTTVTITRVNFGEGVTLSLGGVPAGVTGSFEPAAPTGTGSTLTVTVGATVTTGTYQLTVDGTASAGNQSTPLQLTVTAAAPSPAIVFQSNIMGQTQIFVIAPDGSGLTNLTNDQHSNSYPKWNSTREQIIFASDRAGTGLSEIYVMGRQGQGIRRQLISGGSSAFHPIWSPSGVRYAFEDTRVTLLQLFVGTIGDSVGAELFRLTTDLTGDAQRPDWSPDGNTIAYSFATTGSAVRVIRTLPADTTQGRTPTTLTGSNEDEDPKFSNDGSLIVFARGGAAAGIHTVTVAPPHTVVRLTTGPDEEPAWSPDGRFIVFSSTRGNGQARHLFILDLMTNVIRALTDSTKTGYEDHEPHWR